MDIDHLTSEKRSWNMSRIKGQDTGPELLLRRTLHRRGLSYVLHSRNLPGSSDMVFPRFRAVVFVHGCYWHRHGCSATPTPSTHSDFRIRKFRDTIARDQRHVEDLHKSGWRVAIVWECSLKGKKGNPDQVASYVHEWLLSEDVLKIIPEPSGC